MFSLIQTWAEFVKFSHTIFALPFALAAMAVAARENRGWPGWRTFLLIVAAMVCARTCAMAFNRIVDRRFDALNPRTATRHLPAGKISVANAVTVCVLSAAGLVLASFFLNPLCFYLSPVALAVVCFYSLTKRFTDYTHVFLGIALALAPLGAWIAVKGFDMTALDWSRALVLALAVVLWLVGFDIIYALQDYEFDRKHGLHSLVVAWGPKNALNAAFIAHFIMCGVLLLFGLLCRFRIAYLVGWMLIVGCIVLEHWIARRRSLNWVQRSFFKLNAIISVIFFVITVGEVVFRGGPPRLRPDARVRATGAGSGWRGGAQRPAGIPESRVLPLDAVWAAPHVQGTTVRRVRHRIDSPTARSARCQLDLRLART